MMIQVGNPVFNEIIKNIMINHYPYHIGIIIYRNEILKQGGQHPKCLFLIHYFQKSTNNKIKTLTIYYFRVSYRKGFAYSPKLFYYRLLFKSLLTREGPLEVNINLMIVWIWKTSIIIFNNAPIIAETLLLFILDLRTLH